MRSSERWSASGRRWNCCSRACSPTATSSSRTSPASPRRSSARSLADVIGLSFTRVQFTPDLLPGDVTGSSIFDARNDAVRVPPRSGVHQPAARRRDQPGDAEGPVRAARGDAGTAGHGRRRHASRSTAPFLVVATQNPIELEGHVSAARGAARPVHVASDRRLSRTRTTNGRSSNAASSAVRSASSCDQVVDQAHLPRDAGVDRGRLRRRPVSGATSSRSCARRVSAARSTSARVPRGTLRGHAWRRERSP